MFQFFGIEWRTHRFCIISSFPTCFSWKQLNTWVSGPDTYRNKNYFLPTFSYVDTCGLKVQHGALFKFFPAVLHTSESTFVVSLLFLVFSDQLVPKRSAANMLFLMWSNSQGVTTVRAIHSLEKKKSLAPFAYLYYCQSSPKALQEAPPLSL